MKTHMTSLAALAVLLAGATTVRAQDPGTNAATQVERGERGVFDREHEVRAIEGRRGDRLEGDARRMEDRWMAADIRSGDPTGGSDLSPSTGDPNDNITWGPHPKGFDSQKMFTPR